MAIRYTVTTISPKYHQAILEWQRKNFPELDLLLTYWEKYFPGLPRFQLVAKVGELPSGVIEVGKYAGQPKIERAAEMAGNMFYTARRIIRAQCSTEFGSIEQHQMSLDSAPDDETRFEILRIMAEELRHAYQMFWVLDHDPTWKRPGHGDVAAETIEELLSMRTGTHVLDAFNIEFRDFLDNAVYTAIIDLVGKYQLEMMQIFSYAPMARSMPPMLGEEGFHMGFGRRALKELAVAATRGQGAYSVSDIQRAINKWYPRGLEMFGNERSGETAVAFGFKPKTNGQAQAEYIAEVEGIIEGTNIAIVRVHHPNLSPDEARNLIREVQRSGESRRGIRPEDLLVLPDRRFFRRRGPEEYVFQPYDLQGNLITERGQPIAPEKYLEYLARVLPESYLASEDFRRYAEQLKAHHERGARDASPFWLA
jgi:1,2-phenylacetyl-CoA epoxidase catalytic subunit